MLLSREVILERRVSMLAESKRRYLPEVNRELDQPPNTPVSAEATRAVPRAPGGDRPRVCFSVTSQPEPDRAVFVETGGTRHLTKDRIQLGLDLSTPNQRISD
jgi:hypothetical protein